MWCILLISYIIVSNLDFSEAATAAVAQAAFGSSSSSSTRSLQGAARAATAAVVGGSRSRIDAIQESAVSLQWKIVVSNLVYKNVAFKQSY